MGGGTSDGRRATRSGAAVPSGVRLVRERGRGAVEQLELFLDDFARRDGGGALLLALLLGRALRLGAGGALLFFLALLERRCGTSCQE